MLLHWKGLRWATEGGAIAFGRLVSGNSASAAGIRGYTDVVLGGNAELRVSKLSIRLQKKIGFQGARGNDKLGASGRLQ